MNRQKLGLSIALFQKITVNQNNIILKALYLSFSSKPQQENVEFALNEPISDYIAKNHTKEVGNYKVKIINKSILQNKISVDKSNGVLTKSITSISKSPTNYIKIMRKCIYLKDVHLAFNSYLNYKKNPNYFISAIDFSDLISLFCTSIKRRDFGDSFRIRGLDQHDKKTFIENKSSIYLKRVFCDMIKENKLIPTEQDWDNLFIGLSRDLDIVFLEQVWWTVLNKNYPHLIPHSYPQPCQTQNFEIFGIEEAFSKVRLSTVMFNSMMRCRGRHRYIHGINASPRSDSAGYAKTLQIFDQMVKVDAPRNIATYNSLIAAAHYHFSNNYDFLNSVSKILQDLKRPNHSIKLMTILYSRILSCFHERRLYKPAQELYEDLSISTVCSPDIYAFNTMLLLNSKTLKSDQFDMFYENEMHKWNFQPSEVTLGILIGTKINYGDIYGVKSILEEFKVNYNILPNMIGYTSLVKGYCSVNDSYSAEVTIKEYMSRSDLPLIPQPFHHLMKCYALRFDFPKVYDAYQVLIYAKLKVPFGIWRTMLRVALSNKNPKEGLTYFVTSTQENHIGKWEIGLLQDLIELFVYCEAPLDQIVESLQKANLPEAKFLELAGWIKSLYFKASNTSLPKPLLEKLTL